MLNKLISASIVVLSISLNFNGLGILLGQEVRPLSQSKNIIINCKKIIVDAGRVISDSAGQEIIYSYNKNGQYHEIKFVLAAQDENGRVIHDLQRSNFTFLIDGKQIESDVEFQKMSLSSAGANFAIILDASLSMYGKPLAETKAIAKSFLSAMRPEDRAGIIMASTKVKRLCDLKNGETASTFVDAVSIDRSEVGTAYYDALMAALNILQKESARKAVIAFWDGEDNESAMNLAGLIAESKEKQCPIFVIGDGQRDINSSNISKLTSETGGLYFKASRDFSKISDYAHQIYEEISNKMRDCYGVIIQTDAIPADGRVHSLQVRVEDSNGRTGISKTYNFITAIGRSTIWQTIPKLMIPLLSVLIALIGLFIFTQRRRLPPTSHKDTQSGRRGTKPLDPSKLPAKPSAESCPICQRPMSPSQKKCECGWEKRPPISLTGD